MLERTWRSSVGAKALLAASGLWLLGWLVLHMAANLLVFSGAPALDGYAAALRRVPALLWAVRGVTLLALGVHVALVVTLLRRARRARGERRIEKRRASTIAARTMRVGGVGLLVFLVLHLLHLTFGTLHPAFDPARVHANLTIGLAAPLIAAGYALAALLVGLHAAHGLWAAGRSLGLSAASGLSRRPLVFALGATLGIGFAIVPIAVALGWVR